MTKSRTMSYSIRTRNFTQVQQGRGLNPKEEELEVSEPTNDHRLSNEFPIAAADSNRSFGVKANMGKRL